MMKRKKNKKERSKNSRKKRTKLRSRKKHACVYYSKITSRIKGNIINKIKNITNLFNINFYSYIYNFNFNLFNVIWIIILTSQTILEIQ